MRSYDTNSDAQSDKTGEWTACGRLRPEGIFYRHSSQVAATFERVTLEEKLSWKPLNVLN